MLSKLASKLFLDLGKVFHFLYRSLKESAVWLVKGVQTHPVFSVALVTAAAIATAIVVYRYHPALLRHWLKVKARRENPLAQQKYAEMCFYGRGGNQNFVEARINYQLVIDYGCTYEIQLYDEVCKKIQEAKK